MSKFIHRILLRLMLAYVGVLGSGIGFVYFVSFLGAVVVVYRYRAYFGAALTRMVQYGVSLLCFVSFKAGMFPLPFSEFNKVVQILIRQMEFIKLTVISGLNSVLSDEIQQHIGQFTQAAGEYQRLLTTFLEHWRVVFKDDFLNILSQMTQAISSYFTKLNTVSKTLNNRYGQMYEDLTTVLHENLHHFIKTCHGLQVKSNSNHLLETPRSLPMPIEMDWFPQAEITDDMEEVLFEIIVGKVVAWFFFLAGSTLLCCVYFFLSFCFTVVVLDLLQPLYNIALEWILHHYRPGLGLKSLVRAIFSDGAAPVTPKIHVFFNHPTDWMVEIRLEVEPVSHRTLLLVGVVVILSLTTGYYWFLL